MRDDAIPVHHSSFVRFFEISLCILLDIADARNLTAKEMIVVLA